MFCNHCGKEIKDGTKYCPNCGSQIHWQTISEISELKSIKKTHKRRKRIRNGLFLMLALAVIAMGILYFFGEFPVSRWQGDENIAEGSGSMMSALGEGFTDRQITDSTSAALAAQDASDALGFTNALDELSACVSTAVEDECYYRFQQYYNEIPVYQRYVTVIATENGDALGIFTDAKDISKEISLTPTITDEEAKESIQEYAIMYWVVVYDDMSISELSDDRLVIYDLDESEGACLAYELTVFNDEVYHVILDAQNGKVLDCISTISEVSGIGTNVDGTLSFLVDYNEENDTYTIFDEERHIYLFNLYGDDCTEALAGDTFDETAFGNRKITSVGDNIFGNSEEEIDQDAETATNLVTNVGLVIEYFENTFGQEVPFGSMLLTYNDGYKEGNNACASPATFAEDESVYGFLSIGLALDGTESHILAHEYTHLIEDYYCAATGSNSDYGINEGFADTFACFYTLGWDIDLSMIGGTHRNAVDPSEYGYPASILEKYQADSDDIHAYATVISHAAYLMYDSGNFTMEELQQLWYKTLLKLPTNCTYYDLRMCMEQTAIISGYFSEQQEVVSDVYDEIGIYSRYPCANSIDLFVYDKQGNLYDDCTVIINGTTAGGLFGIGSKSYDLTLLWDSPEACNIELDNGSYEITIIDNANSSIETFFSLKLMTQMRNKVCMLLIMGRIMWWPLARNLSYLTLTVMSFLIIWHLPVWRETLTNWSLV